MAFKIVEAQEQLDAAWRSLEDSLKVWAGNDGEAFQREGLVDDPREYGRSFSKREDLYLYLFRNDKDVGIGVALTEKDRDLVRVQLDRDEPARQRKRVALATEDDQNFFLLINKDELGKYGVRDAFKKLAGAPNFKRAEVGEREYAMLGPIGNPQVAETLLSLAGLNAHFEKHVDKVARLAAKSEGDDDEEVYRISNRVKGAHKVHAKVVNSLFESLRSIGFMVEDVKEGDFKADFAMTRADASVVFEIKADSDKDDFLKAIGELCLVAPVAKGRKRVLVLPQPRDPLGDKMKPWAPAFAELGMWVILYDIQGGKPSFWTVVQGAELPADVVALFPTGH